MKNIYLKAITLFVLTMSLSGCSGLIDDVSPDTSIPLPNIKPEELPLVVKGMYSRLTGMYYMTSFADDVASDNLTSVYEVANNINFKQYDDCNVGTNDAFIAWRMYAFPYKGIGLANVIINLVNDKNLTDPVSKVAKGEALLMRAYCYTLLAERFGRVVITLGLKGEPTICTQNPEEEVWQRIISDLKDAILLLPDFTSPNSGSIQAAKGLLARVYLNYGVLNNKSELVSNAGTLAQEVIAANSRLSLNSDFKQNFISTGTGSEVIWRLVETVAAPTSDWCLYRFLSPETYTGKPFGSTWMEDNLYALYNETADKRKETIDIQPYAGMGQSYPYCVKFKADPNPVYIFVRLAEMHLIVAEVAAHKGVVDVTEYNAVRSSRNASVKANSDFINASSFLKEIENERRREFVAEGIRWMDMRRFGSIEAHLESKMVDKRRVHFPVAFSILSSNTKLVQTDYYN